MSKITVILILDSHQYNSERSLTDCSLKHKSFEPKKAHETVGNSHSTVKLIKTAPFYARILLRAVVSLFGCSGRDEGSFEDILEHFSGICHLDGLKKPKWNELLRIANWLQTGSFIHVDDLKNGVHTKGKVHSLQLSIAENA